VEASQLIKLPGLQNDITRPGSASENTIYGPRLRSFKPRAGKNGFLDRIRLEGQNCLKSTPSLDCLSRLAIALLSPGLTKAVAVLSQGSGDSL